MSRIVRITQSTFPHLPVRSNADQAEDVKTATQEIQVINPEAQAPVGRCIPARQGPSAPFLAQYVDQHWPWPRDAKARLRTRVHGAQAYAQTNELPLSDNRGTHLDAKR